MIKQKKKALSISAGVAVVLFAIVFSAHATQAATYYFDSVSGNDDTGVVNDQTHPYQTLYWLCYRLTPNPGDSVLFKRGDTWYTDYPDFAMGGRSGVTYGAYGTGNKPVFNSGNKTPVSGWTGPTNGVYKKTITFSHSVDGMYEDDHNLGNPDTTSAISTPHCYWYYDSASSTLYYRPTSGVATDHVVRPAAPFMFIGGAEGSANHITYTDLTFIGAYVDLNPQSADAVLSYFTVKNCDFLEGAQLSNNTWHSPDSDHFLVDNCNFDYAAGPSLYFNGRTDYLTIQNCTVLHSNETRFGAQQTTSGNDNDAIYLQNNNHLLVQNNEIGWGMTDSYGAIHLWHGDNDNLDVVIRNNYIHDVAGFGILLSGGYTPGYNLHSDIYNNIISGFGLMPPPADGFGTPDGIDVSGAQTAGNPSTIYNNVVRNGPIGLSLGGAADYLNVENNIVVGQSAQNIAEGSYYAGTHNIVDYNLYYPDAADKFDFEGSVSNFANWRTSSKYDAHSPTPADPKFLNATGNFSKATDFQLAASSPAVDKGANVGLTSDFAGTSVPQGSAPDIGAYEYTSGGTPPPTYSKADLNQDGSVNATDFGIIKTDFFKLVTNLLNPRSDIDADGQVTAKDVGIMMSAWK